MMFRKFTAIYLLTGLLSISLINAQNPIIHADVPDNSMIRVGDAYYMSSTTMHMSPGLPIMKSKDLANWELIGYAYGRLVENDAMNLENGRIFQREVLSVDGEPLLRAGDLERHVALKLLRYDGRPLLAEELADVGAILDNGPSYQRQRAAAGPREDHIAVVDLLVAELAGVRYAGA